MANSADPDQLASLEANWSESTLFAKTGYIRIQHDKGSYGLKAHNKSKYLLFYVYYNSCSYKSTKL